MLHVMTHPSNPTDLIGLCMDVWLDRLDAARTKAPDRLAVWLELVTAHARLGHSDDVDRLLTAAGAAKAPMLAALKRLNAEDPKDWMAHWHDLPSRKMLEAQPTMVLAKDGIGDQLRWAHHFLDLCDGSLITVDAKLLPLMRRHFPQHRFYAHSTHGKDSIEADGAPHLPRISMADLDHIAWCHPSALRPDISLQPDPMRRVQVRRQLDSVCRPGARRIGFCFRSMQIDLMRSIYYLTPDDLAPLFRRTDCDFITLQYGQTPAETDQLRAHLGDRLILLDDFDPIDDLEAVAAVTSCLDRVVSVSSMAADMAGALGTPVHRFMIGTNTEAFQDLHRYWYGGASTPACRGDGDMWRDVTERLAATDWV